MPPKTEFIAKLVYEKPPDWISIEEYSILASHPEVAYQLALAKGQHARGSNRFIGIADLREKTEDRPLKGTMVKGDASTLVVEKDELAAFNDPRWTGVPHDPDEITEALREPPLIYTLVGLDEIPWERLEHAYGSAQDVPHYLEQLASVDEEVRQNALWSLRVSIFHQETLYSATAAAVPFLLKLASIPSIPNRIEIMQFLANIVRECRFDRLEISGQIEQQLPPKGEAEFHSDPAVAIYFILQKKIELLTKLRFDGDPYIEDGAVLILNEMDLEDNVPPAFR